MSQPHPEIGPELRQLAQAIVDRLDPALRMMTARMAGSAPGKCEQAWCPVCALAAVIEGEQHPMLTVIAEHSEALLAVVRAIAAGDQAPDATATETDGGPDEPPPDEPPPSGPGRYEHIPVTVEE
jgi:hypothetical protein